MRSGLVVGRIRGAQLGPPTGARRPTLQAKDGALRCERPAIHRLSLLSAMTAGLLGFGMLMRNGGIVRSRALAVIAAAVVLACTPSRKAARTFFPPETLGDSGTQRRYEKWFGRHLRAMGELPIHGSKQGTLVLRFLWLRTWDRPVVVRLVKTSTWQLVAKQTDGQGGYEPGTVSREEHRVLTHSEGEELEARLEKLGFWELPSQRQRFGRDGARWVLEAAQADRYHVVNYWSPKGGPLHDFCLHLLGLTKLDIEPIY
jgi:hypothetical protein